uniref:Uncharacterized protein n=1 Tax=Anopheles atroparvus TaxID=41427 RepID=A0A182IKT3_ANOAO
LCAVVVLVFGSSEFAARELSMASPFSNLRLPTLPNGVGMPEPCGMEDQASLHNHQLPRRNSELPPGKRQSPLKLSIPTPRSSFSSGSSSEGPRQAATAPVLGGQMPNFAPRSTSPRLNDFHQATFSDFDSLDSPMLQLSPEHSPIMTQLMTEVTSPGTASSQGSSSNGSSMSRFMRFSPALHHHASGNMMTSFPSERSSKSEEYLRVAWRPAWEANRHSKLTTARCGAL